MALRAALSTATALVVMVAAACSGGADSADDQAVDTSAPTATTTSTTSRSTTTTSTTTTSTSTTTTVDEGDTQVLTIYLPDTSSRGCTEVVAVERRVEPTRAVATSALEELFAGPTSEERRGGLGDPFGEATDGMLRSVHVEDSIAYVDLTRAVLEVENLSTSCLSGAFAAAVEATVTQFGTVDEVRLAVNAEPSVFYNFMQVGCPPVAEPGDRCDPAPFRP